jgi:hypothetical protein
MSFLHKSVAADLGGDDIDEVVIVTLVRATNKMLINKGVYNKNGGFTVTQAKEYDTPSVNDMLPDNEYDLPHIG